jgi:dTDP-4-amino-4,6-dideoxygalactose transaminase
MQVVTYPTGFIDRYLAEARRLMETGQVAEGDYFKGAASYVKGMLSIPVTSGGAAIFALLAYQKHARGKKIAFVQSNTMRALYTVPSLLGYDVRVVDSTWEDFMSMSPDHLARALEDGSVRREAAVVCSIIGGYLSPSFARLSEVCRRAGVPLVIDAAHGHYLDLSAAQPEADIAYSYYATKILPAGEGGLVSTSSQERHDWVRRFLMYDRFQNQLSVGINLRAGELTGAFIHQLMTDASVKDHFKARRVELAGAYTAICNQHRVRYLNPAAAADYNGYKLVIRDPYEDVRRLGTRLTEHAPTSGVFDTDVLGRPTSLPHWCPPTYPSLQPSR